MLQHDTPGFGQRQTAAAALEKLYLIAGFEFADMLAHSGLRNVKLLGAFGEIEVLAAVMKTRKRKSSIAT